MTIEETVFQKQRPNFARFPAAGFTRRQHDYQLERDFMDGQFHAVLRVTRAGQVSGNVIDNSTGEEYLPAGRPLRSLRRPGQGRLPGPPPPGCYAVFR